MSRVFDFINSVLDHNPRMVFTILQSKITKAEPLEKFDDRHPCLFVLSTGRVGTETLANLYGLEKSLFSYHEPQPKLFTLSKLAYEMKENIRGDAVVSKVFQAGILTARSELMNYSLICDRGYVETSPQCTFLAKVILCAFPDAKFIHLVRNPYDVVRSGMRRGWYNGHKLDANRIEPLPGDSFAGVWRSYSPYQKNLWLWAETNRWILDFSESLPENKTLRIQAESVFQKDSNSISQLYKFIQKLVPSERRINLVINKKLNMQRKGEFSHPSGAENILDENLKNFVISVAEKLKYSFN